MANRIGRFRDHKYQWTHPFSSTRHQWSLVGPVGGISFHVSIMDDAQQFPDPTCGLEFHHSSRAEAGAYLRDGQAPHHAPCWLLGEPCWHDGTSLYASEGVWPRVEWLLARGDHLAIFAILESEYTRHFEAVEEAEQVSA